MCVLLAVADRSFLTHLRPAWKGIGKLKTFLLESINKSVSDCINQLAACLFASMIRHVH